MKDWRYWRNLTLFGLVTFVFSLALALTMISYQGVQGYIHPPRGFPAEAETPAFYDVPYDNIILETADGLQLAAWYTPPHNQAVILVAHGHASHRWADLHAFFAQAGYGVLSWDFRAHGDSQGAISTIGYYEALDVEAALDFVLKQEEVERVGAWGGSMGGAAVISAAARRPEIEAIVVDSAFAAIEDELDIVVLLPALRPLVRFLVERETGLKAEMLKPVVQIGNISPRSVFIVQGLADAAIALDSAERLYTAAGEPRLIWVEHGVGHLGMRQDYPDEYRLRVIEFFDQALLEP